MALVVKNPHANAGDKRRGFDPWVGKIPWRRACQPTPLFLPRESMDGGHANPLHYSCLENPRESWWATYSPWGHKESDRTERTQHTHKPLLEHLDHLTPKFIC